MARVAVAVAAHTTTILPKVNVVHNVTTTAATTTVDDDGDGKPIKHVPNQNTLIIH